MYDRWRDHRVGCVGRGSLPHSTTMTIHILKWRPTGLKPKLPRMGAMGDSESHVFNCPKCARPLVEGTPRCPGCGVRLIMGVVLRRAATLMGFGFVLGMFLGGIVLAAVITNLVQPTVPVAAAAGSDTAGTTTGASVVPGTSAIRVIPDASVPAAGSSSMRQASLLDARIVEDAAALSAAVKSKASAVDIALALRSLASDAAIGTDLVRGLRGWEAAHQLAENRATFYDSIASIARDGLRASMTDKKSYRASATRMLRALTGIAALDRQSRDLAGNSGIELPAVDLGSLKK
jgi:hypothetical protein